MSTMTGRVAHTAGPWSVSDLDHATIGPRRIVSIAGHDVPQALAVARVYDRTGETDANARLIAAAPELLAALRDVLACFESGAFGRNTDSDGCADWALKAAAPLAALARAKAALAKADGR